MKTYRQTGDCGCKAVVLKHFCSITLLKVGDFHHPLIRKQVLREHTLYIDIFKDGVA